PDWSRLPALEPLVRRCLTKDRRQRLQAIGEARIALENPVGQVGNLRPIANRPLRWIATSAVLAISLAALSLFHFRETPPAERTLRYTIAAPEGSTVESFALSPDGRTIAIAAAAAGKRQLWLRALDEIQMRPLPGTDDARWPFWSPDSRYIGF